MKKKLGSKLVLGLLAVGMISVSAVGANIPWDGSGSPEAAGYSYVAEGGVAFYYDTPLVGMMQQEAFDPYALWQQAGTQTRAVGWTVETRVIIGSSSGPSGCFIYMGDDVGDIFVSLAPEAYTYTTKIGSDEVSETIAIDGGWHVLKMVMAPGGANVEMYVDDILKASAQATSQRQGLEMIRFGDGSSGNTATAWWDYVNVTETPEPATMSLLAVGATMTLLRRKRAS